MDIVGRFFLITYKLIVFKKTPSGLRSVFEDLGPTFIKLGQLLSSRPDFIPKEYSEELRKLLDQGHPIPFAVIKQIIREELGNDGQKIFKQIEEKPISSASIGQVHQAVLKNNDKVVIKVRRPDIKEIIARDTKILRFLTYLLSHFSFFQGIGLKKIIDEFIEWIEKELDFRMELERGRTLANNLKNLDFIKIPNMYSQYSTEKILVSEYIEGITVNEILNQIQTETQVDLKSLKLPFPIDFPKVISEMIECYVFKQILTDGFFHGDPHPANLILMPENRIALVDFGIMAVLDKREHSQALMVILSIVEDDPKMLLNVLTTIAEKRFTRKDEMDMTDSLSEELHRLHGGTLREASIGELILNILSLGRKYNLHWSPGIILGMRAVALIEGIGLRLVPNGSIVNYIKPHMRKYLASEAIRSLSEVEIYKKILDVMEFSKRLSDLKDIISEKGIKVVVEDENKL
jgi:ubiquinone biosynthesis protein